MKADHVTSGGQRLTQVGERHEWWGFWPGGEYEGEALGGILAEGRAGMSVGRQFSTVLWVDMGPSSLLCQVVLEEREAMTYPRHLVRGLWREQHFSAPLLEPQ